MVRLAGSIVIGLQIVPCAHRCLSLTLRSTDGELL
jgi:hypothetical protein